MVSLHMREVNDSGISGIVYMSIYIHTLRAFESQRLQTMVFRIPEILSYFTRPKYCLWTSIVTGIVYIVIKVYNR